MLPDPVCSQSAENSLLQVLSGPQTPSPSDVLNKGRESPAALVVPVPESQGAITARLIHGMP